MFVSMCACRRPEKLRSRCVTETGGHIVGSIYAAEQNMTHNYAQPSLCVLAVGFGFVVRASERERNGLQMVWNFSFGALRRAPAPK